MEHKAEQRITHYTQKTFNVLELRAGKRTNVIRE